LAHDRITYGIFTWDFARIDGQPQIPQRKLKPIKMPGVWGKAFKLMSQEADPAQVTLEAPALSLVEEMDWIASMAELTGRPITLYTGTGVPYQNQIFHSVVHVRTVKVAVGKWGTVNLGSDGRLLTFTAVVEYPFGS